MNNEEILRMSGFSSLPVASHLLFDVSKMDSHEGKLQISSYKYRMTYFDEFFSFTSLKKLARENNEGTI